MAARHVIAEAMAERHEEIRGGASPLDYDGARLVLAALERKGYTILAPSDAGSLAEFFTQYSWRPKSDPRFGTGDGPGWFDANSKEHALHMVELWQAELRMRLIGPWDALESDESGV